MKKIFYRVVPLILLCILIFPASNWAQGDGYRSPDQVVDWVKRITNEHPGKVRSTIIATTPGNRPVYLLEIGNETGSADKTNPSIFVSANMEGVRPLTTEGALLLAEEILSELKYYDALNWYIIPSGNPDAASRFFETPLYEDSRNDAPINDDWDDQTDEDGVNDLNKDGWITQMRIKHPDGPWIVSDSDARLMRKADPKKGEQGIYKLYTEGIDDDGDGKYNEDGPGGTSVDINFPFLFKHYTVNGGIYPGSTPEAFAVMKFVFEHPDIAMIFSLGSTNFCFTPPKGGRKGEADLSKIRVQPRQARMFGLDASRTYTMQELLDIVRAANPTENIDESMIAGFLGLGAALNPQAGDLLFYNKYAKEYKDFLKKQGSSTERFEPAPAKDGSLELWGYFHVGVPVFSMDLWEISKPVKDSAQAEKQVALLAYSDSLLEKKGFLEWEPYDHPTLGEVEIGGFVPFVSTTPPYSMADSILALQIPWVLEMAGELPALYIYNTKVTARGSGVYQLEVWVENRSFIPFPTAMGKRNRQPAPAVLIIENDQLEFLSGYKRTPIRNVEGKSRVKLSWIFQVDKPEEIILNLESKTAGRDQKSIKIGG
jgi:hypothetical protein